MGLDLCIPQIVFVLCAVRSWINVDENPVYRVVCQSGTLTSNGAC